MERTQHDELAELFAHNMHLTSQTINPQPQQKPTAIAHAVSNSEKDQAVPIHFISSHYTHTGHIRADATPEATLQPPPSYQEAVLPQELAETLRQNSIDPSTLQPHQIDLFANAYHEQQQRLLELWRISPPSYPLHETHAHSTSPATGCGQHLQPRTAMRPEEHMFDTYIAEEPLRQQAEVEPYIERGYAPDATHSSPSALDPVYAAVPTVWHTPSYTLAQHVEQQQQQQERQQQQDAMEEQYGMVQQIRNHADWERLNQQLACHAFPGVHHQRDADDEMVM